MSRSRRAGRPASSGHGRADEGCARLIAVPDGWSAMGLAASKRARYSAGMDRLSRPTNLAPVSAVPLGGIVGASSCQPSDASIAMAGIAITITDPAFGGVGG